MYRDSKCKLQAHRGVCTEAPENTMAAFRLAVEQGYDIIECDPKMTSDNVCVMMHDYTINRTGRLDGKVIEEPTRVKEIPYELVAKLDVGEWFAPEFKGEQVPTLAETLQFGYENNIELKIDSVIQTFTEEQQMMVFEMMKNSPAKVGLTCDNLDLLKKFAEFDPTAPLHYDGPVTEEALQKLATFCQGHETTVWMRLDNDRTSWNKNLPVNKESAARIHQDYSLGVWLTDEDADMALALEVEADVVETGGGVKP